MEKCGRADPFDKQPCVLSPGHKGLHSADVGCFFSEEQALRDENATLTKQLADMREALGRAEQELNDVAHSHCGDCQEHVETASKILSRAALQAHAAPKEGSNDSK